MNKKKRILIITATTSLILIGGFWALIKYKMSHFSMPPMPPTLVSSITAQNARWQEKINTVGTLSAIQGVMLKAEVPGRVTEIYFHSGTEVTAGTPLVQLNPDIMQAQLDANLATLALDKINFQRDQQLLTKGVKSRAEYDQTQATYKASLAQASMTKAQLEQTLIRAPFSGKVGLRQISIGDYLNPGQAIVNLQELTNLRVDFTIPARYSSKITKGNRVLVTSSAHNKKVFHGKVYAYDAQIDNNTQTLAVRARLPNKKLLLIPGNFVNVTVFFGNPSTVVLLPQSAVLYSDKGSYVYKVIAKKAKQQMVEVIGRRGSQIAISNGIKAGDEIITAGQIKIHDGADVNAVNENASTQIQASTKEK